MDEVDYGVLPTDANNVPVIGIYNKETGKVEAVESIFGGLNVNSQSFEFKVSMGMIAGFSIIDKFGKNPDLSPSEAPEDLREQGGVYPWGNDAGETLFLSSSNNLDKQLIDIDVLTVDASGNFNKETISQILNGQEKLTLATPSGDPVVRVFRMENQANAGVGENDGDIRGTVYAYYDDTITTPGVPDTHNKILSVIINGSNQTKQLNYTIPTGYVGFLRRGESGVTRSQGTDECDFAYRSRRFGKVFKEKKDYGVMTTGSNNYLDLRPFPDPIPAKTDLSIRVQNVSANNMGAWGTFHVLLIEENLLEDEFLTAIGQIKRV